MNQLYTVSEFKSGKDEKSISCCESTNINFSILNMSMNVSNKNQANYFFMDRVENKK